MSKYEIIPKLTPEGYIYASSPEEALEVFKLKKNLEETNVNMSDFFIARKKFDLPERIEKYFSFKFCFEDFKDSYVDRNDIDENIFTIDKIHERMDKFITDDMLKSLKAKIEAEIMDILYINLEDKEAKEAIR